PSRPGRGPDYRLAPGGLRGLRTTTAFEGSNGRQAKSSFKEETTRNANSSRQTDTVTRRTTFAEAPRSCRLRTDPGRCWIPATTSPDISVNNPQAVDA